jgi:trehalose 6-phosphate phosphatase
MKNILAHTNRPLLSDFACSSVLLGFDYDGTLAPIVSSPPRARMRLVTRRLLSRVARCYPCVVISGRRRDDLAERLRGLPLRQVFGNHGIEPWSENNRFVSFVREWVRHLRASLSTHHGLVIEDKKYSVTVHYRHVDDKEAVRRAVFDATRGLRGVRVLGGVQAVNLIPRYTADKGVALQRARRVLACDTAIYVGDDDTDEDAFASAPPSKLLGIRVGRARASRALYRLNTQRDIDRLLQTLLTARAGAPAQPAARSRAR